MNQTDHPPAERGDTPKLSIVTTAFRSEDCISEFLRRALAAASAIDEKVELIVVDDGSPDRAAEIVREAVDRDPRIVLVQLSRNFGHHKALIAGLEVSRGDIIFVIDSDLEEEPENIKTMYDLMKAENTDVVLSIQKVRKGGRIERLTGRLFYWIFSKLSEVNLPRNVSTMQLMTRRYLKSFLLFRDRNPVFVPLGLLTGYKRSLHEFEKGSRKRTTYSFRRRLSLLMLAVTSFTARPLFLVFWFSTILSLSGFLFGAFVIVRALFGPVQDGWTSIIAAIVFFSSVNAFFTGVVGLYIKLILDEVKDRPRSIVQEIYRR